MARDYGKRNRAAQDRLEAAGQPRGDERGALYRWRTYQAEQRGLSARQGVGKPRAGEQSITALRRAGVPVPRPGGRGAPPDRGERRRTAINIGGRDVGAVIQSNSKRYLISELRAAGRRGERVSLRITAQDHNRPGGPRTRTIGGGDQNTRAHIRSVVEGGDRPSSPQLDDGHDVEITSKPHIFTTSDPAALTAGGGEGTPGANGLDPDELADYLDAYDDIWDALIDLWMAEYGEYA